MTEEQQTLYGGNPTGSYTDNLDVQWQWECPVIEPEETKPAVDMDEAREVPYDEGPSWMHWVIWLQYGSGIFSVLGLPFYLSFGFVAWWYYLINNITGMTQFIEV